MQSDRNLPLILLACLVTAVAGAQSVTITGGLPANIGFVDLSTSGGTAIAGASDDSEHTIVTTVGNTAFPAGNVRIGNNGVAIAGLSTGDVGFTNNPIPAAGSPNNLASGGTAYLMPFWDDLQPQAGLEDTTIWWQEANGVLFIMWKNESHFAAVTGQGITFEIQVFSNPSSCGASIQFLYPDTVFGGSQAFLDDGASATIGYAGGGTFNPTNFQWSFNLGGAVTSGTVLSVVFDALGFIASSPSGPGSLLLQYGNSTCALTGPSYVMAVTLNQGTWPFGWLFGVDISVSELASELSIGAPFVGSGFAFSLGTFTGLPGITFYAVVLSFDAMGTLSAHSNALSYTIP